MRKMSDIGMNAEERALAKRENSSILRLVYTFFMACAYGVIAFFALWKLKDAIPSLLVSLIPDVRQSNPNQLYTYAAIAALGVGWLVSFMALWLSLDRVEDVKKRLIRLAIWCLAAFLAYLAGIALLELALRLR